VDDVEQVALITVFAPHIAATAAAVIALVFDAFSRRGLAVAACATGLAVAAALSALAVARPGSLSGDIAVSGAGFSAVGTVVFATGAVVMLGSWRYFTSAEMGGGLAALATVALAAAAALSHAADLLIVLICLEVMAVASYALVWSARTPASTEAAIKFFIQGAVATGLFVLGLAVLFGLYGASTSYVSLNVQTREISGQGVTTAFALLVAAFSYKLGAFPFHSWAPDAFESAPPHASALLAGIPKLAAGVAMMLLFPLAVFSHVNPVIYLWVFGALAAGSMAFGVFGGLVQRSYTRMLGYSGVAHVGFALIALATGPQAMNALAAMLIFYAIAAAGAYLAAGCVRALRPAWDGSIEGMAGIGRQSPLLGFALTIALFSLVGMPLTAGFWGKFLLLGVAVSAGLWWLALIGVIASVVSFGYYGAVLKAIYFSASSGDAGNAGDAGDAEALVCETACPDRPALAALFVLSFLLLAAGIVPLATGLSWIVRTLTFV